ncbi:amino acid permease [Salinisphaera orenii MK-B5]|uniref:Amino acid permease n=1 Tax=Salinisphaera orenii MK-B5 TaxID=856730 RepID=A0A423PEM8_9GAMM|nr:APC family permease [Salinisphaera orenii]ROO23973.1 amino acid permease [Salinisphaera orenii MK-B5]
MTTESAANPGLKRTLTLSSVVILGVAWVTPLIALATIGIIIQLSNGTAPTAYLITLLAMVCTAWSYGRMASVHYQSAGSAYTYVGEEMGPRLGFLTGWLILLDYFFIPLVVWLIGAAYLSAQFPIIPMGAWIVAFIVPTTLLNIIGIQVTARANYLLVAFQLLVIAIFVALSLGYFASNDTGSTLLSPFANDTTTIAALATAAAVAAYSFIGFDGLTLLTEETIDPKRTIPRAMLIVVVFFGVLFVGVSWTAQLIHPGVEFASVDSAALELARMVGGNLFNAVVLAGLIVGQFACGLAIQAGASRLLFTMGRDGTLPSRLAYVSPTYRTPVVSIVLIGLTGLVGLFVDVTTSASFINFGAFSAFTLVNLSAIVHYWRHRPGQGIGAILGWIVVPLAGVLIDGYLLLSLGADARIIGSIWLALGVLWLAVLTRGFRQPPPKLALDSEKPD